MTFVKTALFHKAGEGSGGGGGGDQHNLGWYATESALTTAHATATDGDWAIVGSTDTVWVWDSDSTGWKDTGQAGIELPDQTGHSGDFLTTNGSSASWSNKPLVNVATGTNSLAVGSSSTATGNYSTAIGNGASSSGNSCVVIGSGSGATKEGSVVIGSTYVQPNRCTVIGRFQDNVPNNSIAINCSSTAKNLSGQPSGFWLSFDQNNNYHIVDSNGLIPTGRLKNAINKYSTMPTAAAGNEGWIVQFTGTTDATYTHGYIYECVSDGGNPATYSWTAVQVQAGGSSLPSQTGNSGKFLTTDGTDASWGALMPQTYNDSSRYIAFGEITSYVQKIGAIRIGYKGPYSSNENLGQYSISIGDGSHATGGYSIAIGPMASKASGAHSTAINGSASAAYAIQLGNGTNSNAQTFKVGNENGNFEIMSADGTIPTARLTKVNSAITLTAADWSGGSQTVTVNGVTSTSVVFVAPDPSDTADYVSAGILCTSQTTDSLTFTATTTPTSDIDVNIVCL